MTSIQNIVGNDTEKLIVKVFRENGYYVYNTPHKTNGQPVDIIAARGGECCMVFLCDAKHTDKNKISFSFDRIEPNQITALRYARDFAKLENLGFAILFERDGSIRWLPFETFEKREKNGLKSIRYDELELFVEVIK